jgi:hypothetical protein
MQRVLTPIAATRESPDCEVAGQVNVERSGFILFNLFLREYCNEHASAKAGTHREDIARPLTGLFTDIHKRMSVNVGFRKI